MPKKKATKRKPAKKPVKKAAKKKVVKKKRKANPALMKPVTPSAAPAVVGAKPAPRGQMTKRLWDYIKKNKLQDKVKKTMIHADDKLKVIFGGKKSVSMFEMTKHVSKHLKS